MLSARSIRKGFGPHDVLESVEWGIPPGSRWGLVGANGSGKTTLLRILAGGESPDAGRVDRPGGSSIAYLPQEGGLADVERLRSGSASDPSLDDDGGGRPSSEAAGTTAAGREHDGRQTLLQSILSPFSGIAAMEAGIERLQHALAEPGADVEDLTRKLGDAQQAFESAGGYTLETEAKIILGGLGFGAADHARPIQEFSGGYRMRALLGSLLLGRPDYLLLDEPTNHLDLEAIGWLESYLSRLPSALVIVSHDRLFLNRLVTSIAELDRGSIRIYRGDYDRYRAEKAAIHERAVAAAAREEKRRGEVERFIERFRYKATKARQVQDRIRMLDGAGGTVIPEDEVEWGFRLPRTARPPRTVLQLTDVRKSFGATRVLDGVDLTIERGDRVALVGPNGCGKSTLMKIACGLLPADDGDVSLGEGVVVRYAAQHVLETLTPGRTVLEEMQELAPSRRQGELRSLLGIFQFSGDDVFKKVEVLSGGEKNRLALAKLALEPGNFLVLDEPTNHLDLAAREALEEALDEFDGALLFASHDRWFISRVARRVAGFSQGKLRVVEGDYDAYAESLRRSAEEAAARDGQGRGTGGETKTSDRRAVAEARNTRNRALRSIRREVTALEEEIARRESRLHEIATALADPSTYKEEGRAELLGREQKTLAGDLESLIGRWEEASARLHAAEGPDP